MQCSKQAVLSPAVRYYSSCGMLRDRVLTVLPLHSVIFKVKFVSVQGQLSVLVDFSDLVRYESCFVTVNTHKLLLFICLRLCRDLVLVLYNRTGVFLGGLL